MENVLPGLSELQPNENEESEHKRFSFYPYFSFSLGWILKPLLISAISVLICSVISDSLPSDSLSVDCQASLFVGCSRQEYYSGLLFASPGYLPNAGINQDPLHCRWILYCLSHQGSPKSAIIYRQKISCFTAATFLILGEKAILPSMIKKQHRCSVKNFKSKF